MFKTFFSAIVGNGNESATVSTGTRTQQLSREEALQAEILASLIATHESETCRRIYRKRQRSAKRRGICAFSPYGFNGVRD